MMKNIFDSHTFDSFSEQLIIIDLKFIQRYNLTALYKVNFIINSLKICKGHVHYDNN
jgi:hypothetical protein